MKITETTYDDGTKSYATEGQQAQMKGKEVMAIKELTIPNEEVEAFFRQIALENHN